jgi:hypothetical protein
MKKRILRVVYAAVGVVTVKVPMWSIDWSVGVVKIQERIYGMHSMYTVLRSSIIPLNLQKCPCLPFRVY